MIAHAAFVTSLLFVMVFSSADDSSCLADASRVGGVESDVRGSLLLQVNLPLRSNRADTSRSKAIVNIGDQQHQSNLENTGKQLQSNGDQLAGADQQRQSNVEITGDASDSTKILSKINAVAAFFSQLVFPSHLDRADTSKSKAMVNTRNQQQQSNVEDTGTQWRSNGDQPADADQQPQSNVVRLPWMWSKFNAVAAQARDDKPLDNRVELLASFASSQFASKCRDPDEQGRKLQLALKKVTTTAKLTVAYLLSPYIYTADHLLPLICALPGPIIRIKDHPRSGDLELVLKNFGIPLESIWVRTSQEIQDLVTSGKYLVVACNDDILEWWSHPFGTFLGRMNTYRNTITVSHGIDEDQLWSSTSSSKTYQGIEGGGNNSLTGYEEYPYPSLLFAKTAARIRPDQYGKAAVMQKSKLNPSKKTILFLCKETCGRMQSQDAKDLSRHFNLVISPHPKYKADRKLGLPAWAYDYVVDAPDKFPLAVPLVDIADVVIGQPSGLMSLATHTPAKKLIVLSLTPPGTNKPSLKTPVLDDETAHVLYERPLNWTSTIYDALKDTEPNRRRERLRASYFKSWFGCVDGYEDYRLLMLAFDRLFNLDISDLSTKYYQISDATCSIKPRSGLR